MAKRTKKKAEPVEPRAERRGFGREPWKPFEEVEVDGEPHLPLRREHLVVARGADDVKVEIGERYRHYRKGKVYVVLWTALHAETKEEYVVYALDVGRPPPMKLDGLPYTQPLERFLAEVEPGVRRMTKVGGA